VDGNGGVVCWAYRVTLKRSLCARLFAWLGVPCAWFASHVREAGCIGLFRPAVGGKGYNVTSVISPYSPTLHVHKGSPHSILISLPLSLSDAS